MKRVLPFRPTVLAVAIAAATSYTYAADTNTSDVLDTLEVTGQTYRNTATKTQLDLEETPQAISTISSEELETRGVESVVEAIRYTPGVNTELRGGSITRLDLFNIRGFDNTYTYYDGLPLLSNGNNLQIQVDPTAISQIEVFKGPASTLYGSTPPGGVVNMISKAPQQESKNVVELAVGSDNKKEASFDSTGAISDTVNYRVIGLIKQKDGQAETTEEERIMIAPSLDIQVTDNTLLNLNLYYQNDPSMGTYGVLPGMGTTDYGQFSSDSYFGDVNFDSYEREVLFFGYKLDHEINNSWSFLQNTRFSFAQSNLESIYAYSVEGTTAARDAYATDEEAFGVSVDNQLSTVFDIGETEHNLLMGIDFFSLKSNFIYDQVPIGNAPAIDILAPDYDQVVVSDLGIYRDTDVDIANKQLGFYLQDQVRLDQLVLLAGLRYDRYESQQTGTSATYGMYELEQDALTGRVGALYELDNGISPYISYSEGFEPQSGTDTSGNAYVPTTSTQLETGIKYARHGFNTNLAVYEITKNNVLTTDPDNEQNNIQVGELRSRGIELEIQKSLSEEVSLSASANIQDVEVTKDNSGLEGTTPIRIPEKQFSAWLSYEPTDGSLVGSSFGLGVRYIGEMQIDAANSGTLDSYKLVDLSMGYDLAQLSPDWKGASIQFSMANVLDETYFSCYTSGYCWAGADRSFELKGRYEF